MAIYLFSLSLITLSNLSALEIGCKQGSSGFILRFSICPLYLASALTTIQNFSLFFSSSDEGFSILRFLFYKFSLTCWAFTSISISIYAVSRYSVLYLMSKIHFHWLSRKDSELHCAPLVGARCQVDIFITEIIKKIIPRLPTSRHINSGSSSQEICKHGRLGLREFAVLCWNWSMESK